MRHVRMLGLCLVAAVALAAVAASSASAAEPEWAGCVPQKKGEYTNETCTAKSAKAHKGSYEFKSGQAATCVAQKKGEYTEAGCKTKSAKAHKGHFEIPGGAKFTSAGGAGVLETAVYGCENANGEAWEGPRVPHEDCVGPEPEPLGFTYDDFFPKVECASEHASGEAVGSDEVANVSVRFTGCELYGLPATTHGLPAGEVQVNQLKGRLGYINKAAHEVGMLLEPAAAGGQFAEFEVNEGRQTVHVGEGNATEGAFYEEEHGAPTGNDGIISPITPVNQMTHTFTQNYRIEEVRPYQPLSCRKHTSICNTGFLPRTGPYGEGGEGDADIVNVPSKFEGGSFEALEDYAEAPNHETWAWSSSGEELTNVNTLSSGYAEIKG